MITSSAIPKPDEKEEGPTSQNKEKNSNTYHNPRNPQSMAVIAERLQQFVRIGKQNGVEQHRMQLDVAPMAGTLEVRKPTSSAH